MEIQQPVDPIIARLFPNTPGYNEDNGALLDLILHALPADRIQTVVTVSRSLAHAGGSIQPEECGLPLISYEDALGAGHIPALRRYWSNPEDAARLFAAPISTETPHLDDGFYSANTTMRYLITHGQFEALQLSRARGCPWDITICYIAAKYSRLEILQWARAQDPPCPWHEHACTIAAKYGRLEVLQWLRRQEPPCPWSANTDYQAAQYRQLACLQWAHDNGCPRAGEYTCEVAAQNGHLAVLQWVRAQDPPYPWTSRVCTEAAKGGHLEVLQWARAQDPPCPWNFTAIQAATNGHDEVAQWLRDNGCPEPP